MRSYSGGMALSDYSGTDGWQLGQRRHQLIQEMGQVELAVVQQVGTPLQMPIIFRIRQDLREG